MMRAPVALIIALSCWAPPGVAEAEVVCLVLPTADAMSDGMITALRIETRKARADWRWHPADPARCPPDRARLVVHDRARASLRAPGRDPVEIASTPASPMLPT